MSVMAEHMDPAMSHYMGWNQEHQDTQSRQDEAQRQEVTRQHQEAVHRQQQDEYRLHQEAIEHHRQAIAEAQARHHQLQQQTHQLQHQLQQRNNHHQVLQQHQQISQPKGRMPKKGDSKPRGRMTAYAFFVQTCREEHKKKHPEENVVFAEFSKKCAERWKTMLDKEKKRFHEMAETDKKRYDTEMQSYTPPKGEKQRGKKRKQIKDPNAPKRSLSAFFWFSNDERGKVKAQNPEYGVGDIAKELGRRWADADPEVRSKFEALADKDKIRYEKEMTAYKKKLNPVVQPPVPEEEPEDEDDGDDDDDE
uniref:HMG box domain-containing protein n=1 Tax=Dendroctonus ponderosae TaxID=77166 RepID=J3JWT8_DENPD|nr:unknown [Dendroctonus ponderosae]